MEDIIDKQLVLSDSDDDIDFTAKKKHGKQALRIVESDSEVDDLRVQDTEKTNESTDENVIEENPEHNSEESNDDSSDDGEKISFSTRKKKKRKKKSDEHRITDEHASKINSLCDEDSSSDESDKAVNTVNEMKTKRAPQRMSAKQAEEQMKIIQSESQRLARECHMSVPYHKPKQHSLKDFLNRRTINRPVPMAVTKKAAATIKMSIEELEEYAKSLEDRNKESQEFYRSDSDDSINDDKENDSKRPEEEKLATTDTPVEPTEASSAIEESTEDTNNTAEPGKDTETVVESMEVVSVIENVLEKSKEVPIAFAEPTEAVGIMEESKDTADKINVDMDMIDEIIPDAIKENAVPSTSHENEKEERENLKKTRETIEIDYDFGESERTETKWKNLLPHYSSDKKPCLKGPVNGVINLDSDEIQSNKTGENDLLERFIKHVAKKSTRSAKEVRILSTDNGVIEIKSHKIESEDQNSIHSQPRKDYYRLREELSLRIAAKRKEELKKKQMSIVEIPNEDSDSDFEIQTSELKEAESCSEVNKEIASNCNKSDVEVQSDKNIENCEQSENEDNSENDDEEGSDENEKDDDGEDEGEGNDDEDATDCAFNDSNILDTKKQRKRIIVMDNSDDDETALPEENLECTTQSVNLNSTFGSLEDNQFSSDYQFDKTVSQIFKNQNLADKMIDSCSEIVPEQNSIEIVENNMSALFTQTTQITSQSELLDLCSGSFVTQVGNINCVEPNYETQMNNTSDNEFSDDDIGLPKKSKPRKVVNISDDEENANEVENALHNDASNLSNIEPDSDVGDDNLADEEKEERIVEYDSEENEIEVPIVQKKKISDFFENEAELSESEWGSADEDERNLDKFEIELGDEDEFDRDELVSELDRIHRRRMLDQDAREVKIIKDTHFEDEEENGLGRQRQYKWKHMENSLAMDENQITDNIDANGKSDDENEETWRRMRHERNNILQETKNQNDKIDETKLIVTTKTKKRISIVKTAANLNTSATKDLSFLISKMKEEQSHRSSLLIRDEATLANLAKMTSDDSIPTVNTTSKNFLFNVITSEEGKPLGKRKLDDGGTESESKTRKTTKRIKKSTLSVLDKLL